METIHGKEWGTASSPFTILKPPLVGLENKTWFDKFQYCPQLTSNVQTGGNRTSHLLIWTFFLLLKDYRYRYPFLWTWLLAPPRIVALAEPPQTGTGKNSGSAQRFSPCLSSTICAHSATRYREWLVLAMWKWLSPKSFSMFQFIHARWLSHQVIKQIFRAIFSYVGFDFTTFKPT